VRAFRSSVPDPYVTQHAASVCVAARGTRADVSARWSLPDPYVTQDAASVCVAARSTTADTGLYFGEVVAAGPVRD